MEIDYVIQNADGTVTTVYKNGTSTITKGTGSGGGYSTGNGTTISGEPSYNTGKKWWETALGVLPAVVSSIFGGNALATPQPQLYQNLPQSQQSGISTNMILILAAAVVLFLLFSKKK